MGLLNEVMCDYLSHKEIFADFVNGVLFSGNQEVCSKRLRMRDKEYYSKKGERENLFPARRRDIIMSESNGISYAIVGLELQGEVDHGMPVRCLEYDTLEYSRQLSTTHIVVVRNCMIC